MLYACTHNRSYIIRDPGGAIFFSFHLRGSEIADDIIEPNDRFIPSGRAENVYNNQIQYHYVRLSSCS